MITIYCQQELEQHDADKKMIANFCRLVKSYTVGSQTPLQPAPSPYNLCRVDLLKYTAQLLSRPTLPRLAATHNLPVPSQAGGSPQGLHTRPVTIRVPCQVCCSRMPIFFAQLRAWKILKQRFVIMHHMPNTALHWATPCIAPTHWPPSCASAVQVALLSCRLWRANHSLLLPLCHVQQRIAHSADLPALNGSLSSCELTVRPGLPRESTPRLQLAAVRNNVPELQACHS